MRVFFCTYTQTHTANFVRAFSGFPLKRMHERNYTILYARPRELERDFWVTNQSKQQARMPRLELFYCIFMHIHGNPNGWNWMFDVSLSEVKSRDCDPHPSISTH